MIQNLTQEGLLPRVVFLLKEKTKIKRDIEKFLKAEKAIDAELAELIEKVESSNLSSESHPYTAGKKSFTFKGKVNHANHIARLAIEELAAKYNFNELEEIVNSDIINPWAKTLKIIVDENQISNTGFIDPERRYFTKYPLKSKDGVRFFVTTQWDVRHKTRTGTIEGSFIRLINVLKVHGIEIHENNPELQN